MLKSLHSTFTHTKKAPVKLRGRYQMNFIGRANHNNVVVIFEDIASKLEKNLAQFFQVSIHFYLCHS